MLPYQQTAGCARAYGHRLWQVSAAGTFAGLQARRVTVLPWLHVVRLQRFGRGMVGHARQLLESAVDLVRERGAVRLHVEAWTESEVERSQLTEILLSSGFRTADSRRSYRYTVWIDLLSESSESDLLRTFHPTCRRHIRAPMKRGLEVRRVSDPVLAGRMKDLVRESFVRTGGHPPSLDWSELIRQARAPDSPVCIAGLFREDSSGPAGLVGFGVAYLHGDVAEYAHAGATRATGNVPLLYAPTWHLMQWARMRGAHFWDFGGVVESEGSALEGIRDFKRMYSRQIIQVGDEWVLDVRPRVSRFLLRFHRPGGR